MTVTDDLVERLRAKVDVGSSLLDGLPVNPDGAEAADRIEALTAENERLNAGLYQAQEIALKAWADKTEWVQQTCQNHELGLHRADVLRYRIEALTAENERLREALERVLAHRYGDWCDIARAALGDTQ